MKKRTGIILLFSVLLTGALVFAFMSMFIPVGGKLISVRSDTVDLSGSHISDITRLYRLSSPSRIILLDCGIEPEEARSLAAYFPDCDILWDIPLSGGRFHSDAEEIRVSGITRDDIPLLFFFTRLRCIDTRSFILSADLLTELETSLPDCTILYSISTGSSDHDAGTEDLVLDEPISLEEAMRILGEFPHLQSVDLTASVYPVEDQLSLLSAYPGIRFIWNVELCGTTLPNDVSSLSFPSSPEKAIAEMIKAAPLLPEVRDIDLGESLFDPMALAELRGAFHDATVHAVTEAFDQTFSTDTEELDFSGTEIEDLTVFDTLVSIMPELKKVVLCDCGIEDAAMDALNHHFDGVRFVWKVYFSIYSLRTDATYFCASDVPERNYIGINMNDSQIYPIRYCTDLVALDLGHMTLMTDLSILKDMTQLRFLIIGTSGIKGDISILSNLKELYYLELFHNTVYDLSPLLECKKLAHLNIGYCTGYDIAPLLEMKQLERLWIPGNSLTEEQKADLEAALPNTYIYMPRGDASGSTGGGWRENEAYYEMRDLLHMHYMRGDAGYHRDDNG